MERPPAADPRLNRNGLVESGRRPALAEAPATNERTIRARMTWTDEELVARSIRGDADSFNELILRWERPIYALAYRTIGREEDARDVCQETFLRAFRALPAFRGQAKFSSWLYRIALNLCRDWMRRERRTPTAQSPDDADLMDLVAGADPSESIESIVARKDLTRRV